MSKQTVEFIIGDDVVNTHALEDMPIDQYAEYIEHHLFLLDHHDILRATIGGYPVAVNQEQINTLIQYLQSVKANMPRSKEVE